VAVAAGLRVNHGANAAIVLALFAASSAARPWTHPQAGFVDVSVVIPLFNGAATLRRTIESVLAQDLRPVEIIVVDDGSNDGSPDIARSFADVTVIRHSGKGPNPARQAGFARCSGMMVAFLDQDDLWHREHLSRHAGVLSQDARCPAAVADVVQFREEPDWPEVRMPGPVRFDPWECFPFHRVATPSAVLYRRAPLAEGGGWPSEYPVSGDYLALLRVSTGTPLLRTLAPTTAYRLHVRSLSNSIRLNDPARYLGLRREAMTRALTRHAPARPEDGPRLHGQLETFGALERLLVEFFQDREAESVAAARELDRLVWEHAEPFRKAAVGYLVWFLDPLFRPRMTPAGTRFLRAFGRHWTAAAPRLHGVLAPIFHAGQQSSPPVPESSPAGAAH
jgi:hypothetical protein